MPDSFTNPLRRTVVGRMALLLCLLGGQTGAAVAGSVQLKSGHVIEGRPAKLLSLANAGNPNAGPVPIHHIVMIQDGSPSAVWRRYFVPMRQVPDNGLNLDADLSRAHQFTVPQRKGGRIQTVQSAGSYRVIQPFDPQFGRRTVELTTQRGPLPVVQGITIIAPDHVMVSGITHVWDFGLGLSQVPLETIVSILNNPLVCKPDDPQDRLARARFYVQAEWYPLAFAEMESIARDFPDLEARVAEFREELLQLFGRHILRELARRREAGQFETAEQAAQLLPLPQLGPAVQREVRQFVDTSSQERDHLERIAALLGDLQAQLPAGEVTTRVSALRVQLIQELDRSGLDRLQPFRQAAVDPATSPAEKLALAFTGWVLGSEGADTDLDAAIRLWDARHIVREYLREPDVAQRAQLFEELQRQEGLGPTSLKRLLVMLPPPLDAETVQPGEPATIDALPREDTSVAGPRYTVILPPEYSPQRRYPCLVALRPNNRTAAATARWWAGDNEQPGWGMRRGYIVIAPEYVPEDLAEYNFSPAAHRAVLDALRDARLRFAIDPDRVFLAGHDLGGDAAFDIGFSHPDQFAGVIPIGGISQHYGPFLFENGQQTAWYIIRGELGRDSESQSMAAFLDRMFVKGAYFDMIYVQYVGRGLDSYADEQPRLFDWMDLHRRPPPPRDFEYRALRQTDDEIHWVRAGALPRNYILPQPAGVRSTVDPMKIRGHISEGNTITLQSASPTNTLRLFDGVVDFDRKVTVRINTRQRLSSFVKPDLRTMLEDFRRYGDRARIAAVLLEL
jgi:pimeloyl-ACP methyl ester carboxylesterase